jgi:IS30 family transposase
MERADMWGRWKAGYHLREIARAFGRDHGSIRGLLAQRGGIAPRVRIRSLSTLTLKEREDISRGIAAGESGRLIAKRLGRAASTICREIARHGGRSVYRASRADSGAWESALRPKRCLLALNRTVRNLVASKLMLDWSPEQIAGWLRRVSRRRDPARVPRNYLSQFIYPSARSAEKGADRTPAH